MNSSIKIGIAFVAGALVSLLSTAGASQATSGLEGKIFSVTINEIVNTHVKYDEFSGTYRKTLVTSDGKTRVIELTPVVHKGAQLIRVRDNSSYTYMPLSGTVTNGKIFIQTNDVASHEARLKAEGW